MAKKKNPIETTDVVEIEDAVTEEIAELDEPEIAVEVADIDTVDAEIDAIVDLQEYLNQNLLLTTPVLLI